MQQLTIAAACRHGAFRPDLAFPAQAGRDGHVP